MGISSVKADSLLACCLPSHFPIFVLEGILHVDVSCDPKCLGVSSPQMTVLRISVLWYWGRIFSLHWGKAAWQHLEQGNSTTPKRCLQSLCRDLCWPQATKDQDSSGHKSVLPSGVCPCSGTLTNCRDHDTAEEHQAKLAFRAQVWSCALRSTVPFNCSSLSFSLTGESGSGGWERGDEVWSWCFFLLWGDGPHSIARYVLLPSASGMHSCTSLPLLCMRREEAVQGVPPPCPWGWCKGYLLASETARLAQRPWEGPALVVALTLKPSGWKPFASSRRMWALANDVFGTGGQLCSFAHSTGNRARINGNK